jgi:hypothetical protein
LAYDVSQRLDWRIPCEVAGILHAFLTIFYFIGGLPATQTASTRRGLNPCWMLTTASNTKTDTVSAMYLNPNKKKSDQCAFICKEVQQTWFLAIQLCRILHDTHSVVTSK